MTMNVFIFRNLSLKTVFIEPDVKINYSLSLSLCCKTVLRGSRHALRGKVLLKIIIFGAFFSVF